MADRIITVTDPSVVTNDTLSGYNNYSDIDGQLGTTMTPTEATNGHTVALSDGVVHEVTTKPVGTTNGEFSAVVSNAVSVDLAVTAWTLDGAVYDSVSRDVSSIDTSPSGIFFKPDGTRMYLLGNVSDNVTEIILSPAWDITSGTAGATKTMTGVFQGLWFSPDGLSMFTLNATGNPRPIQKFLLSVAWDLSTVGNVDSTYSVTTFTVARTCSFSDDGSIMYVSGDERIEAYDLGTAWDITTAGVAPDKTLDLTALGGVRNVFFQPTGKKAFIVDNANTVHQYSLSVAWDISTGTTDSFSLDASTQTTVPIGEYIKPDGSKLYLTGLNTAEIYQYSMG